EEIRLVPGQASSLHLPSIGFGMNTDDVELSGVELERLRVLRPEHMRVELHLNREYAPRLEQAIQACEALNSALEIAVFLTSEMGLQLDALAELLGDRV